MSKIKRRKTFKQILIKKLIKSFIFTVIALFFLTVLMAQVMMSVVSNTSVLDQNYMHNNILGQYEKLEKAGWDMDSEEGKEELLRRIMLYSSGTSAYVASAVLDGNSGEVLWSGDQQVLAIINERANKDSKPSFYLLEGEIPEEILEINEELNEYYDKYIDDYGPSINASSVYIKDRAFKLGAVTHSYYDNKASLKFKVYDFTPENTEGYTLVVEDEDTTIMGPLVIGLSEDEYSYKLLHEYINGLYGDVYDSDYGSVETMGVWDTETAGHMSFIFPNGDKYIICKAAYVNVWDIWLREIIITYVVIVLIVLIVTILTARIKYLRLKAGYDMEDYRITMTNTMAHDLKTPLMAVSGYAENLKANVNPEKNEYYSEAILDNVGYMNDIIANVLELSQVEVGRLEIHRTDVDVRALIDEISVKHSEMMKEAGLDLKIKDDLIIKADRNLMKRAFDNILVNAIKYGKPNSTIEVTLNKKSIIFVNETSEDVGDNIENLWKPFVKGDNSRSNRKGTGVGLSIVKNILTLHNYKLELSLKDNRFTVVLKL